MDVLVLYSNVMLFQWQNSKADAMLESHGKLSGSPALMAYTSGLYALGPVGAMMSAMNSLLLTFVLNVPDEGVQPICDTGGL